MANEALSTLAALALIPGILAFAVAVLAAIFAYEGDADIRALGAALATADFSTRDPKVVRALRLALATPDRLRADTGLAPAVWAKTTIDVFAPTFALETRPERKAAA